jgi:hypothetical protein
MCAIVGDFDCFAFIGALDFPPAWTFRDEFDIKAAPELASSVSNFPPLAADLS